MIQRRLMVSSLSLLSVIAPGSLNAYELATHARVTHAAVSRSVLSSSEFIKGLGIDPPSLNFFRGRLEAQDAGFTETGIILRVKHAPILGDHPPRRFA